MWKSVLVTRFCSLKGVFTLNRDSFNRDVTVACVKRWVELSVILEYRTALHVSVVASLLIGKVGKWRKSDLEDPAATRFFSFHFIPQERRKKAVC